MTGWLICPSVNETKKSTMVVDVYFGPCSDPGSNPGVSTNMTNIIIVVLAILFIWFLLLAQKTQRVVRKKNRRLVDKIKQRDR